MNDAPDDHDEPELAGYEPHERPLRGRRFRVAARIVVGLGLVALVLPGILVTLGTAQRTAAATCAAYAAYLAPEAVDAVARFEWAGTAGAGWACYAVEFNGDEVLIAALGLIPGGPRLPAAPVERS